MSKKKRGMINIPADPPEGPSWLPIIILMIIPEFFTKAIGAYLIYKRLMNARGRSRNRLYRRFANAIGDRTKVSIRELAASMDMPTANAASDLQEMIDKGVISGNAYIDHSHMMLYLDAGETSVEDIVDKVVNIFISPEDREKTVAAARATSDKAARPAAEAPREAAPAVEPAKPKPVEKRSSGTDNADFEAKLKEIRQLNDEIDDAVVSEKIDRIGELTASIFRVVREKPERAEEVRRFMNYYLPTTLKLLKSYSLMEKQSYQGENIVASRKKIENVLDTLVHAFEQQQDRLFRVEALDVDSDISVLETMMTSDGLLEQKAALHPRTATSGEGGK